MSGGSRTVTEPKSITSDQMADQVAQMMQPELSQMGDRIEQLLPEGWFFAVTVWPSNQADGNCGAYVSNCPCRHHLMQVLRTWARRLSRT